MVNLSRKLNQVCTYWALDGLNVFGKGSYTKVSLFCRWEDIAELFLDKTGKEVVSNARVFLDTPILTQGYLYLGSSDDDDPTAQNGAYEIRQVKSTPNLRALQTLYVAYL